MSDSQAHGGGASSPATISNRLLASLGQDAYASLSPHLRPLAIKLGEVLHHPGEKLERVYFVEHGMISLLLTSDAGTDVEVGVIGREGAAGVFSALTQTPVRSWFVVQIHGKALILPADIVRREFERGGSFQQAVLTHLQSLTFLASQAALCNRLHSVEKRLARWLLMVHDRVGDRHLELTHEFLAGMLGTRRAGVTEAAGALRRAGLIEYDRGHVKILDREGLEASTCECYAIMRN
jgi:CRP-like cAMP-binding protein